MIKLYELVRLIALLKYREQQLLVQQTLNLITLNMKNSQSNWILETR
jgi:hypothetical protein